MTSLRAIVRSRTAQASGLMLMSNACLCSVVDLPRPSRHRGDLRGRTTFLAVWSYCVGNEHGMVMSAPCNAPPMELNSCKTRASQCRRTRTRQAGSSVSTLGVGGVRAPSCGPLPRVPVRFHIRIRAPLGCGSKALTSRSRSSGCSLVARGVSRTRAISDTRPPSSVVRDGLALRLR